METVNIHEAKTNLSKLLESTANGIPFIIAKSGKPIAKVIPFSQTSDIVRRIGFMPTATIPEDFDEMGANEIGRMFAGDI